MSRAEWMKQIAAYCHANGEEPTHEIAEQASAIYEIAVHLVAYGVGLTWDGAIMICGEAAVRSLRGDPSLALYAAEKASELLVSLEDAHGGDGLERARQELVRLIENFFSAAHEIARTNLTKRRRP